MKICTKCKVSVATDKKQCPLCFDQLEIKDGLKTKKLQQLYNTSKYAEDIAGKNYFLHRLFLFLTICVSSVCLFINFLTNPSTLWSLVVIIALFYVWILVRHTIISRRSSFEKVLFQFVGIMGLVMSTNLIAGAQNWFWNFLLPSASILTTIILTFVLLVNKKRSDFVASFFLMSLVLIAIGLTLLLTGADDFKLLNLINLLFNGLFALGILLFGFRSLKRALHKNFHI